MLEKKTKKSGKGAHTVKHSGTGDAAKAPKEPKTPKTSKKPRGVPVAAIAAGGVLAGLLLLLCGFTYFYPNVFPGVTAGPVSFSGMSKAEAEQKIMEQSELLYKDAEVPITIHQKTYKIPAKSVINAVDAKQSADNAYAVGRTGNPLVRMWEVAKSLVGAGKAPMAAVVNEAELDKQLTAIFDEALTDPVEPNCEVSTDTMTVYAGKPGVKFDTQEVERVVQDKVRAMDFEPYEVAVELSDAPKIDMDKIAADFSGEARNATVSKEDGKTIIEEKIGVKFDLAKAKEIVGDGSAESYTIPVTATLPKVTAADLKEKLFRDTLAQAVTNLNAGNVARTNNVDLASASINGTILNPGEEFSYNGVVGERTEARGYRPAGAYVNGKVVDEFGGGVCQPSSTLYMAVLHTDLEVTERHNHSFTVAYTPLGEDATVDYGNLDFRFKNNTDYPIKIIAERSGGEMIMTIVGTKTNDKTITTRTEVLATYSPQRVEKKDNSMKVGQSRTDITGITGYSTRTYKQITENGKTSEVLANSSRYEKRDQVVYVGTISPTPPPAPKPAPTDPEEPPAPEPPAPEPPAPEPPAPQPENSGDTGDAGAAAS